MSATLLHFGADPCRRILVLNKAGYEVLQFDSLGDLYLPAEAAAILADEAVMHLHALGPESIDPEHVLPRILFRSAVPVVSAEPYDLLVPNLSTPPEWLSMIEGLLARYSAIRDASVMVRQASAAMRESSRCLREESQQTRDATKKLGANRKP